SISSSFAPGSTTSSTIPRTAFGPTGDVGSSGSQPPPPNCAPLSSGSTIMGGTSPGSSRVPLLPGQSSGPVPGPAPGPVPGPGPGPAPGPPGCPPGPPAEGTIATVIPPGVRPPALSSTRKPRVPAGTLPSGPTGAAGGRAGTNERSCSALAGSTSPTTTGVPSPRPNCPFAGSGTSVMITVRSCAGRSTSVGGGTSVMRADSSPKTASPGTTTLTVGAVGASLTPTMVTTRVVLDVAPSWSRTVYVNRSW